MSIFDLLTGGAQGDANRASQAAVDSYGEVRVPTAEEMRLHLETLVQQGELSPEQAEAYLQDPSAMAGITTDPRFQQAQMDALASLQEISDAGGMTAMDRANLGRIQGEEQSRARGAREAILQNMEARGAGGSGASLLAQLQNAQDSASRQSQRDLDVAAQAQSRALQAIQAAGTQAGQMQQSSFNQQAQQATAQDAINRFNAQNRTQVGQANVAARNAAQAQNLAEKQRVADQNVNLRNQQQQYNQQLKQQQYENEMKKAAGKANAYSGQATQYGQQAQQNMGMIGTALQAGATAAAAMSDERLKEDVERFDAGAFLDSLVPSRYRYKDPKHGEGKQVGVMAQDVEKEAPQLVVDTDEGKAIDYNRAGGPIFASLADLHRRLREMEDEE